MSLAHSSLTEVRNSLGIPEFSNPELVNAFESVDSKEELFQLIQKLGIEGGKVEDAAEMVSDLEERINLISHKLKFIHEDQKPSVLILTSVNPPAFKTDNYLEDILATVGSRIYNVQPQNEGEEFNPDIVLIITKQMDHIFGDVGSLLSREEWQNTNAIKNNRVYLLDGREQFQGYNSKIADDIETLAEIIYPQYLTFGGIGDKWIQFEV